MVIKMHLDFQKSWLNKKRFISCNKPLWVAIYIPLDSAATPRKVVSNRLKVIKHVTAVFYSYHDGYLPAVTFNVQNYFKLFPKFGQNFQIAILNCCWKYNFWIDVRYDRIRYGCTRWSWRHGCFQFDWFKCFWYFTWSWSTLVSFHHYQTQWCWWYCESF